MNIDLQKLRETADRAKADQETAARLKAKEDLERSLEEDHQNRLRALKIIGEIPKKCEKAALKGEYSANVMKLSHKDIKNQEAPFNVLPANRLNDVAALVFSACVKAKLKPTLEHWHDGVGYDSGFNIMVHF